VTEREGHVDYHRAGQIGLVSRWRATLVGDVLSDAHRTDESVLADTAPHGQ